MNGPRILASALFLVALSACASRAHLTPTHGLSYHAAFSAQRASPPGKALSQPPSGLDSQEATIIADSYRTSLAPKGSTPEAAPVILLAPRGAQGETRPLAPSVPK